MSKKRKNQSEINAEHFMLETFIAEELDFENDTPEELVLELVNEFSISKAKATRAVNRAINKFEK